MRFFILPFLVAVGLFFYGASPASAQTLTTPGNAAVTVTDPDASLAAFDREFDGDVVPVSKADSVPEPVPGLEVADSARLMTGIDPVVQGPYEGDMVPISETPVAKALDDKPVSDNAPVDLQADSIQHDEQAQTVTASGNVMLVQAGRIFRADQIVYYLKQDRVIANGHVVLNEESGDIHYSDEVELQNEFKDGFVKGLKTYLADGSRFTAKEGERENGTLTTMHDAAYTPCEPCKANPDKPPVWQIRASDVIHDGEAHTVSYRNARFEAWGVPIAYTPYFSHPDGTVKRKSGFLAPSAGYRSNLGAFALESYYWDIAPDRDATVGLMAMTEEAPLLLTQYRQRWNKGELELNGGITYSGRTDKSNGVDVDQDEEIRGHVQGKGRWDINNKWRTGVNINWASDDQYMRQYDFTNEDVLENEIYAERFSGRNYAAGRLLTFQDIRVGDNQVEQPEVLPEVVANFVGEPGDVPVIGGRWSGGMSALGLRRSGSGQDMNRLSLNGGWQRRMVSDYGFLTTVDANARTDLYMVSDRDVATTGSNRSGDSYAAQFYPTLQVQTSYPMVKEYENMQATFEPIFALTISPNLNVSSKIPNEDSQDVQIDASNLFEVDRFPGLDRVEDRSRVTYGVRSGLYAYNGNSGDVFLGQSYRLDKDDNPFPAGSGLDRQASDFVGQVAAHISSKYDLNYRFQLNSENFSSARHEVDASARWNRLSIGTRYLYASGLEDTTIEENREQLDTALGYFLAKDWQVRAGARNDLGEENPGLRTAYAGLDYFGQCWSWSLVGERNFTDDSSGESDTTILFQVGLKNLGGFIQPDYTGTQFAKKEGPPPDEVVVTQP